MRGISKAEVISARYAKEMELRKGRLKIAQADYSKGQETLSRLREEVIKSIQGESVFAKEMLSELVNETDAKVREFAEICRTLEREVEQSQLLIKELSDSYDEIMSWSALFDTASMEAKKMIVNAMITRIDVFKGYRLNVEFSFSLRQFFFGLNDTVEIPGSQTA